MRSARTIWIFVAAVVVIPMSLFAVVNWYQQRFATLPVLGGDAHHIAHFQFTDQDENAITDQAWKARIVVANVFFTHCPSICPKMMYQLKRVQAYASKNIVITSFTVDPERDSAAALKAYAGRLGITGNWSLATGDKKTLYRFARKDLLLVATDGDGGPDDFIHSDKLVLIDPQGRIRGFYNGLDEVQVNSLVQDISKLKNNSE